MTNEMASVVAAVQHQQGSRTAAYDDSVIRRGLKWMVDSDKRGLDYALKCEAGTITAQEIVRALEPLGVWWGIDSQYGDYEAHAESGGMGGFTSVAEALAEAREETEEGLRGPTLLDNWFGGDVAVVFTAKRPQHSSGVPWDPSEHNPSNGLMGNSYLPDGQPLEIIEVRYDAGNGYRVAPGRGIRTTAKMEVSLPEGVTSFEVTFVGGWGEVRAYAGIGTRMVGKLSWNPQNGEVFSVWVVEEYRRKGIATFLLAQARQVDPRVHHSRALTDDGRAWSQAVGFRTGASLPAGIEFREAEHDHWLKRRLRAYLRDEAIGSIGWWTDTGEIDAVVVLPAHRRRGIATELLRRARELDPRIHHSRMLTEDGEAWSEKVATKGADGRLWEGLGWESDIRHAVRDNTGPHQRALCGAPTEPQQREFDPEHPRACKRCLRLTKTSLPSWRDRGTMPDRAEAIIAPDKGRGRRNSYMVYLYGEPHARRDSLAEAKATVEDIYGDLDWVKVPGDPDPHPDRIWGTTVMFNDSEYYLVVERLPRLGATASTATYYHVSGVSNRSSIEQHGLRGGDHGVWLYSDPEKVRGIDKVWTPGHPFEEQDVWLVEATDVIHGTQAHDQTSAGEWGPADPVWVTYTDVPPERVHRVDNHTLRTASTEWVRYHGTSAAAARDILRDGPRAGLNLTSSPDAARVYARYESGGTAWTKDKRKQGVVLEVRVRPEETKPGDYAATGRVPDHVVTTVPLPADRVRVAEAIRTATRLGLVGESAMDVREVYSRTDRIRQHVKQITNAEATALLRRVLTDANYPQADEAYTDTSPMRNSSAIGWDLDTTPPIPVVYLHPRSMTDLVLLHEAAHLLWLGGYRGANHGFDRSEVHDQRWLDIWKGLIDRYADWSTRYEFDRSFGHVEDPEWERLTPLVMRTAATATLDSWRPSSGMFALGKDTLDPRVFDAQSEVMHPALRDDVLATLDAFWTPKYGDWRVWAKVYLAGSAASYWWNSDADLDILIGVDLDRLRDARPANREVSDEDIIGHLNGDLKRDLTPTTTDFHGFVATWFINRDSYDIREVHPYAAYDITEGEWVVKPPVLPANWGPDSIPEETWRRCEMAARSARQVLSLPEPERSIAGTVYFDWVHEGRRAAYSAHGGGWLDPGNVTYQYLSLHPERLLRRLYLCKHPEQATDADVIEKAAAQVVATQPRPANDPVEYRHTKPPYWTRPDDPEWTGGFHTIKAMLNGQQIGRLSWWDPGNGPYKDSATMGPKVDKVEVASQYRRQGIATEMLRRAQEITPGIRHSDELTGDGRAWRNATSPDEAGRAARPARMRNRLGSGDSQVPSKHAADPDTSAGAVPSGPARQGHVGADRRGRDHHRRGDRRGAEGQGVRPRGPDAPLRVAAAKRVPYAGPLERAIGRYSLRTQQEIASALLAMQRGKLQPDPKGPPIRGLYTIPFGGTVTNTPQRLFLAKRGGQWVAVYALFDHDYREAERDLLAWLASLSGKRQGSLAYYSRDWRWQDWARRNGFEYLLKRRQTPSLRSFAQDVLADYGITAPLDLSVASGPTGYSEGGLIDGRAYVSVNPDERNYWNVLHEVAHVVCQHQGMDEWDNDHGPGFRRVFSEILEAQGGLPEVDLDQNPPRTAKVASLPPGYRVEVREADYYGQDALHVLAYHEDKPVAALVVYLDKDPRPMPRDPNFSPPFNPDPQRRMIHVDRIEVYPEHRRKGVATALWEAVHKKWPNIPVMHSWGPAQSPDARRLNETLRQKFGPSMHLGAVRLDDLPEPLGETSIPSGTIRCYHYTPEQNAEPIARSGILSRYARGDGGQGYGNEPSAGVWAATGRPASGNGMKGPGPGQAIVEFWIKPEQVSQQAEYPFNGQDLVSWGRGYHHIIVKGDVPPDQIVAIHQPWHTHARYMQDQPDVVPSAEEAATLPDEYQKAYQWIVRHGARTAGARGGLPEGIEFRYVPERSPEGRGVIGPGAMISAFLDGKEIGGLAWFTEFRPGPMGHQRGQIEGVYVLEPYQRRGIATEMFRRAREVEPRLHHSHALTDEGRAWSRVTAARSRAAAWGDHFRGGTIYRGLRVNLPPDVDAKVRDLLKMETDPESYAKWKPYGGKKVQAGELIVRALEKTHWDSEMGLGRHWSERREMAETAAQQGGRGDWAIVLTATYTLDDVDRDWINAGSITTRESEAEVTLRPGAQIEITQVDILNVHGFFQSKGERVSYKPIRATAARTIDMTPPMPEGWKGNGIYEMDLTGVASTGCVALLYDMGGLGIWPLAWLTWDKSRRTVEGVWVMDDNRGKGIATEMLEQAQKVAGGPLVDSGEYTPEGFEWAKKRGLNPELKKRVPQHEMARMQAQMTEALLGGHRIKRQMLKVGSKDSGQPRVLASTN